MLAKKFETNKSTRTRFLFVRTSPSLCGSALENASISTICSEEKKRRSLKQTHGGLKREARPPAAVATDSLRADIFVFMYLWDLRSLSLLHWLQREWLKTNTRRDSSPFQPPSLAPSGEQKERPMLWECGNTCNKFTVTPRSAGNASSLQLKKIQSYRRTAKKMRNFQRYCTNKNIFYRSKQ